VTRTSLSPSILSELIEEKLACYKLSSCRHRRLYKAVRGKDSRLKDLREAFNVLLAMLGLSLGEHRQLTYELACWNSEELARFHAISERDLNSLLPIETNFSGSALHVEQRRIEASE